MKKEIVISDLTRMYEGRVCVAGYDDDGNCVRPILPPPGIHESTLAVKGEPIVYPFAVVEYDLIRPNPQPPHTEDYYYSPDSVRFIKKLDEDQKRELLSRTCFDCVQKIFEVPIQTGPGFYIPECQGIRSLGTIIPSRVIKVFYEQAESGNWKYRLGFEDGEMEDYWLTITDLTWRYYCDHQRNSRIDPISIASDLTNKLQSRDVFIRIGLARGWEKYPDRCYLQITGIYAFPDIFNGRTFAEFHQTA